MTDRYLHVEDARGADRTAHALQTQRGDFRIVTVLQTNAEGGQARRPRNLDRLYVQRFSRNTFRISDETLNIGRTCSECVADVNGDAM